VTLRQKIEEEIRRRGPIPFSRYMEMCLYDAELGYYARGAEQFGKAGDFYTSSDVHAVFGRLLARQFEEMWRVLGAPARIELLELGPGRGLFAQDVLDWSAKKFPEFFAALDYRLVERSPALRAKLQETLSEHFRLGKVALVPEQPEASESSTMIFANEFFDALPVEVLSAEGELRIDLQDGRLVETWASATAEELEFLDRYGIHPEAGERVEAPLAGQGYMTEISGALKQGFVIVIDYGYVREEQLAGRHRGTLIAYRQHSVSVDLYEAPGEQDLTAHVNFTALAAAAVQNGMRMRLQTAACPRSMPRLPCSLSIWSRRPVWEKVFMCWWEVRELIQRV
jgi:SAM-dependent MidA family methyltransferase